MIKPLYPLESKIEGTRLTPLSVVHTKNKSVGYLCKCDCGKEVVVVNAEIIRGMVKSCGCYKLDMLRKRSITHGLSKTPEYKAAFNALQRCESNKPKVFKNYKGRGIGYDFKSAGDMAAWLIKNLPRPATGRLLLDRINNDWNYAPGNIRWATYSESNSNKRVNHLETIGGETKTVARWADEAGIDRGTFYRRVDENFPKSLWFYKGKITQLMLAQARQRSNGDSD